MSMRRWIQLAFFIFCAISGDAAAYDFTVTRTDDPAPDGCQLTDCSLREAVTAASAVGGTITLPAGLYQLTRIRTDPSDRNSGSLSVDGDVEINGAGADISTIASENSTGIFEVSLQGNLVLRSVTLSGGTGISGGAIDDGGQLLIEDSILRHNLSSTEGGAIRTVGDYAVVLRRVQLLDNTSYSDGGAVYSNSEVVLVDSVVDHNTASGNGGGIVGYGITVERTTVSNNTAMGDGGGIYEMAGCSCTSLQLFDSTANNNTAAHGGGVSASYPFDIERSTLSTNSATTSGGAIYADDTDNVDNTAKIYSSTLYLNTAPKASAILFHDVSNTLAFQIELQNTIVSGSCEHTGAGVNSFYSIYGNIESPGATCDLSTLLSKSSVPAADLQLGPLADNGGATQTHLPIAGSAAIGNGWSAYCDTFDQRGYVRSGSSCDVGAVQTNSSDDDIFRDGFDI